MKLCYWDLRGLGEISRYILRFSETTWEDDRMQLTEPVMTKWFSEKATMGLDLPNLPYLVDGDINVTQSVAIIRYLGRKFGLVGSSEKETVRVEMAEQELVDYHKEFAKLCYSPREQFDANKPAYLQSLETKLAFFEKFLGEDGPFVLGEKLTYVDFMAYEFFNQIKALAPEQISNAPKVVRLLENFEKLPTLKSFFESGEHKKDQFINSPMATFNGKN